MPAPQISLARENQRRAPSLKRGTQALEPVTDDFPTTEPAGPHDRPRCQGRELLQVSGPVPGASRFVWVGLGHACGR